LFTEKVNGRGIRSMKEPGSAYDDPALGKDPQPAHMKNLYRGPRDNGGVHVNSGIPNRAFYLAATGLGGHAWEKVGRVWYRVLRDHLKRDAQFADAADLTVTVAEQELGAGAAKIVREAWTDVGVLRRAARSAAARKSQKSRGKTHANQGGSKRRVRRDSTGARRRHG
jgi:Zn-dependent metalloprotease